MQEAFQNDQAWTSILYIIKYEYSAVCPVGSHCIAPRTWPTTEFDDFLCFEWSTKKTLQNFVLFFNAMQFVGLQCRGLLRNSQKIPKAGLSCQPVCTPSSCMGHHQHLLHPSRRLDHHHRAPPLLAGLHLALILLTSLHQTLPSSNFQLTNFRFF